MKSESMISSLKYLFYIVFGIQVIVFVSVAFKWIDLSSEAIVVPVAIERYALLLTLVSIPAALKLFFYIMKRNKELQDGNATNTVYVRAFIVRFGILFLIASINIILFAFSFNQNFMLCTLITFTAYLFTYPSTKHLINSRDNNYLNTK